MRSDQKVGTCELIKNGDHDEVAATIDAWCLEQIAPWRPLKLGRQQVLDRFHQLNLMEPNVFLFMVKKRLVELVDKPVTARHAYYEASLVRAVMYREFFQRVVRSVDLDIETVLAVFVGDGSLESPDVPVFAFQKRSGNRSLLLPDVDLILPDFLSSGLYQDPFRYEEKRCSAVFAGSTTGGSLSVEAIRKGIVPRVRAGLFFHSNKTVFFHLPQVTPCQSPEAEELLRGVGFGGGERITWADQFGHRFMLSMDGNGPSCARIAIGLKCNSVLMQYVSDHSMYYFSGLRPWLHYLPIERDEDVARLVSQEASSPGLFEPIARAGQNFVETFLTPDQVISYTSRLLILYDQMLNDVVHDGGSCSVKVLLHVATLGDVSRYEGVWAGGIDRLYPIEGIAFAINGDLDGELQYRALLHDETITEWYRDGELCGSRGQGRPLLGFEAQLVGTALQKYNCIVGARFADGTCLQPSVEGGFRSSYTKSALTAIWIELRKMGSD